MFGACSETGKNAYFSSHRFSHLYQQLNEWVRQEIIDDDPYDTQAMHELQLMQQLMARMESKR